MSGSTSLLGETLHWAIESDLDPAMAAADWLARDIDPDCGTAIGLLTCLDTPLAHLRHAKDAFKTMRVVGETSADRRLAARLYAAAIAAALAHHDERISRQSESATRRALHGLLDDQGVPEPLRSLAGAGLCALDRLC
ncbi:MAG: hypothetical protein ACYTJ0_00195 [Planctomycetota bacterium]|jgi:hypothetical protein